ncbi:MAG: hypothetical protein WAO55_11790 [Candidatus Manganitrophaceae bacterium]
MSQYTFKGHLCGYICAECPEPLANLQVRLYRVDKQRNVAALAVANPKETFAILDDEQVRGKESRLLAQAETDAEGNFTVELGKNYAGEAFEVDVYCGSVPRQKIGKKPPKPRQFTITTLQPRFRETEGGFVAVWDYCLPYRFWCAVLALFDVWTICGRITDCKKNLPVAGVKVFAFDADWLADDLLGAAFTDAAGKFIITYSGVDFRQGTWIDVELIGGPDLYFRVETPGGAALLAEPQSRGRASDRENVGNCFCVELCIEEVPPITEPYPVFRYVGGYNFLTEMDSGQIGDGKTLVDDRAFYSTMRLNGILSKKLNGITLEYRFEWRELPAGGWTPVPPALIARTVIGLWERSVADPMDPNFPAETKEYTVNGTPGPGELVVTPSPEGWIQVPQESNFLGVEGLFFPNGNMINLVTQGLVAWGAINLAGITAGNSTTPAGLATDRFFSIRMRIREAGNPASETSGGILQKIAIDNTLYDNVTKGGTWAPSLVSSQLGVVMVDINELVVGGSCSEIGSTLNVRYTAAHPNIGSVGISMSGPGGPYAFSLAGPVTPNTFGTATPSGFVVADLDPCAYIVGLSVEILLTTGDSVPYPPLYDQVAFCKA